MQAVYRILVRRGMLAGQILAIGLLHLTDIGSDIWQMLKYLDSGHVGWAATMASLVIAATITGSVMMYKRGGKLLAFLAMTHLHVPWLACKSIHSEVISPELLAAKTVESALEAGPQALFQTYTLARILLDVQESACKELWDFSGRATDGLSRQDGGSLTQAQFRGIKAVHFGRNPFESDMESLGVGPAAGFLDNPKGGAYGYLLQYVNGDKSDPLIENENLVADPLIENENLVALLIVPQNHGGKNMRPQFAGTEGERFWSWLHDNGCSMSRVIPEKGGEYEQLKWRVSHRSMDGAWLHSSINVTHVFTYRWEYAPFPRVDFFMIFSNLSSLASLIYFLSSPRGQLENHSRPKLALYFTIDVISYPIPLIVLLAAAMRYPEIPNWVVMLLHIGPMVAVNAVVVGVFAKDAKWRDIILLGVYATVLSPLMPPPSPSLVVPHKELLEVRGHAFVWFLLVRLVCNIWSYEWYHIPNVLLELPLFTKVIFAVSGLSLLCCLVYPCWPKRWKRPLIWCSSLLQFVLGCLGALVVLASVVRDDHRFMAIGTMVVLGFWVGPMLQQCMGYSLVEKVGGDFAQSPVPPITVHHDEEAMKHLDRE